MDKITLSKQQSKTIGQAIYGDIKKHRLMNEGRFLAFVLNDVFRPKKPIVIATCDLCEFCDYEREEAEG